MFLGPVSESDRVLFRCRKRSARKLDFRNPARELGYERVIELLALRDALQMIRKLEQGVQRHDPLRFQNAQNLLAYLIARFGILRNCRTRQQVGDPLLRLLSGRSTLSRRHAIQQQTDAAPSCVKKFPVTPDLNESRGNPGEYSVAFGGGERFLAHKNLPQANQRIVRPRRVRAQFSVANAADGFGGIEKLVNRFIAQLARFTEDRKLAAIGPIRSRQTLHRRGLEWFGPPSVHVAYRHEDLQRLVFGAL